MLQSLLTLRRSRTQHTADRQHASVHFGTPQLSADRVDEIAAQRRNGPGFKIHSRETLSVAFSRLEGPSWRASAPWSR